MTPEDLENSLDRMKRIGQLSNIFSIKSWARAKKDELDYKGQNEWEYCKLEGKLTAYNELLEYCDGLILKLKEENVPKNKETII